MGHEYAICNCSHPFANLTIVIIWISGILLYDLKVLSFDSQPSSIYVMMDEHCLRAVERGIIFLMFDDSSLEQLCMAFEIADSNNHSLPSTLYVFSPSSCLQYPELRPHSDLQSLISFLVLSP